MQTENDKLLILGILILFHIIYSIYYYFKNKTIPSLGIGGKTITIKENPSIFILNFIIFLIEIIFCAFIIFKSFK